VAKKVCGTLYRQTVSWRTLYAGSRHRRTPEVVMHVDEQRTLLSPARRWFSEPAQVAYDKDEAVAGPPPAEE
jgi:hypothetical protein